jgi:hypothetical protein
MRGDNDNKNEPGIESVKQRAKRISDNARIRAWLSFPKGQPQDYTKILFQILKTADLRLIMYLYHFANEWINGDSVYNKNILQRTDV